jgi:branched-chain amino acid transport system ATP-binding protein
MLEIRDITGGYGETIVLRNVSLEVPDGSVVALLGPNGAGKTTTLRMASGLLRPQTGGIVLEGEDITRLSPNQRVKRGICHIPEGRGVFPSLTVRENLRMHSPKSKERQAVDKAVEAFPFLKERLGVPAGSLSGGQQQMLSVVRAWLRDPRVVLVDEASLGLAPVIVDGIFEFLAELKRAGNSLLVVEQYVSRALALADYVYVLNKGAIQWSGKPADLREDEVFASYMGAGAH